jgi:hypothetical protein
LKDLQEFSSLVCKSVMLVAAGVCHLAAKALEGPCAAYPAAAFATTSAAGVLLHVRLALMHHQRVEKTACSVSESLWGKRLFYMVLQAHIEVCMLQARSAATGGQSEPKLLPHAAAELLTVVPRAAKETTCAVVAALGTLTAVLLLAAALPLFVLPHKLLSWAIDRLQKLSWRLRGMQWWQLFCSRTNCGTQGVCMSVVIWQSWLWYSGVIWNDVSADFVAVIPHRVPLDILASWQRPSPERPSCTCSVMCGAAKWLLLTQLAYLNSLLTAEWQPPDSAMTALWVHARPDAVVLHCHCMTKTADCQPPDSAVTALWVHGLMQ